MDEAQSLRVKLDEADENRRLQAEEVSLRHMSILLIIIHWVSL